MQLHLSCSVDLALHVKLGLKWPKMDITIWTICYQVSVFRVFFQTLITKVYDH